MGRYDTKIASGCHRYVTRTTAKTKLRMNACAPTLAPPWGFVVGTNEMLRAAVGAYFDELQKVRASGGVPDTDPLAPQCTDAEDCPYGTPNEYAQPATRRSSPRGGGEGAQTLPLARLVGRGRARARPSRLHRDLSPAETRWRPVLQCSTAATSRIRHHRELSNRVERIFSTSQPHMPDASERGVAVPVESLDNFFAFLVDLSKQLQPEHSPSAVVRPKPPRVRRLIRRKNPPRRGHRAPATVHERNARPQVGRATGRRGETPLWSLPRPGQRRPESPFRCGALSTTSSPRPATHSSRGYSVSITAQWPSLRRKCLPLRRGPPISTRSKP